MHLARLLPHLAGLRLHQLIVHDQRLTLVVHPTRRSASCPVCHRQSRRIHSHYERTLADLPCATRPVRLRLRARRFRCLNPRCARRIFTERFPGLTRVRARRTEGQRVALEDYGRVIGGAGGARLAQQRGLEGSGSTILRLVRACPLSDHPTPRVLGVDDWARKRGQTYGTILVDLERHQVVDLLEDRTAAGLATWLRAHPGIEVIARDRAGAYADGARQGAPEAVQVADRFHLLMNVGEALERVLSRKRGVLKEAAGHVRPASVGSPGLGSADEAAGTSAVALEPSRKVQAQQTRRAARRDRYEAVIALNQQGLTQKEIAREVGIGTKTVRRFLRADAFPERASVPRKSSILDPYAPYLRERWEAGCHNSLQLWREVRAQGFAGAASLLRKFVARWRAAPGRRGVPSRSARGDLVPSPIPPAPFPVPSPRQARWLLLRDPERLRPEERTYREILLERDPEMAAARTLAADFGGLIKERDGAALAPWLKRAAESPFPEFRAFVTVLDRDRPAVEAALAHEWSNGQTEGQITRLKLVKRQMYGRGSMMLLKARVLSAA